MKSTTLREKVFALRKDGYSYNLISAKTGISKSTLSGWLSKIDYIPNEEVKSRIGKARIAAVLAKQKQKVESFESAKFIAEKDVGVLSRKDLFMLGLGVYIGEGSKSHGAIRVANSDPKIIKFCVRWFKEIFGLGSKNFRVRIHMYPDSDIGKTLRFWSEELEVPLEQFQKTYIDNREGKKMFKRGKLPYGTAHLTVQSAGRVEHGVFLQRRINACIEKVMK